MSIGEKLARHRQGLGLSVDDIAATTGMSKRQVMAIEASVNHFAAPVEMNRMIRLYARKVGLSIDADGLGSQKSRVAAGVTPPPIPHFLLKQTSSRAE